MAAVETTEEKLHCIGCGVVIQTTDTKKLGYTPSKTLETASDDRELYCQRCFRLRHYNEIQDISLTDDDFLHLLNEIGTKKALIVNVVDIFDFNGSLIPGLHRFVGKNSVLLVGNKKDLLPKSLKTSRLRQWMRERAYKEGLRPVCVFLTSAKKPQKMETLLEEIEKYRKGLDVYVVGVTNVGKSTLINAIIKKVAGVQELITTSRFPGTTLDKIEIPLVDGAKLFDTPGIIHRHQMAHYLHKKDLKIIAPQKEIKPKVYQLNPEQTLFLGSLARFDFVLGQRQSFVVYVTNDLNLHRTKLAKADEFYQKHLGGLLQPPRLDEIADFPKLHRFEFSIKEPTDIVFAGLGWISVKSKAVVAGYAPEGVEVIVRKTLI
ncbi:MAG: ribosome biogenesis GTPase YqeH [Streptococcaceae bacterium]|jgi:ribosome biogenesis GTPase YqeH|nr:ribosome biogenesis GTPase YqeH [Streptococcaceae bacterium]